MGKEGVFWAAFTAAPASPSLFVGCVFIEYRDGAARVEPFHSLKDCVVETLVPERVGTLKAFAVVPEYQRQGIGRHLFLYAQAEAEYAGCSSIEVRFLCICAIFEILIVRRCLTRLLLS